jgi:DUF438 domain-containing protein
MNNNQKNLLSFAQGMYKGEDGKELYNKYLVDIKEVTPQDIFLIQNKQLEMGISPKELLPTVDKLIHIFYLSLSVYEWEHPEKGSFLFYLMEENQGLIARLESLKDFIKKQNYEEDYTQIQKILQELLEYNHHLQKLENILFPYMQKKKERFDGLKIMWTLHDEMRARLKMLSSVEKGSMDEQKFYVEIGKLFFELYGLVQKQELIMFPAATEILDKEDFEMMHVQSFDFEFPFIDRPAKPEISLRDLISKNTSGGNDMIQMETGNLTFEQVEWMMNTLPVDVTFVDANDKVAFFSKPKDRIFPRSVAVIGRDVRNCHPHESVHVVEKIIDDFKSGKKNQESFWLKMKGMYILIQYFAVRNEEGIYLGTLEVGQEISGIQAIEGEKRLLEE